VKRDFRQALERADLGKYVTENERRVWNGAFTWHSLRHYAVSEPIAQRADIKPLQAIAGHKSAVMTLDRYGHLMTERASEAADLYDPLAAPSGGWVVDGGSSG
jgi:integrase